MQEQKKIQDELQQLFYFSPLKGNNSDDSQDSSDTDDDAQNGGVDEADEPINIEMMGHILREYKFLEDSFLTNGVSRKIGPQGVEIDHTELWWK